MFFILLLFPGSCFGYYVRHPCCSRLQPCGWWGSADYLFLWRKPRFYPPLVTTNPFLFPILTDPGTTILFGDEEVGGSPKSGFRTDFGIWVSRCLGVGTSFFYLCDEKVRFQLEGGPAGQPIFGQPFNNVETLGVQDVRLISFPGSHINGEIDIDTTNRVWGFDLYTRYRFFGSPFFKFDLLAGFEMQQLTDKLDVNTKTTTILLPTTISVNDHFACENHFYAGLVGLIAEWRSCNWAFVLTGKLGLGHLNSQVDISGFTISNSMGTITVFDQGLLAQPSNIGTFSHSKFEFVPQINANLQLQISPHIWLTAGYTYMFWHAVALAGEQVNLNINPTQLPPGPLVGAPSPIFEEHLNSFWIQGVSGGLYFCY